MNLRQRLSELERKFRCLNVRGIVESIDPTKGSCGCVRVRYGEDQLSDWLPVKPIRSGDSCMWWFPDVGEGVTVTDIETGEILPGSFTDSLPSPSRDPDVMFIKFGNGDTVTHNRKTGVLDLNISTDANITTGANVNINASASANITTTKATITAPTIESTGSWAHSGTMSISESLSVNGGTSLKSTLSVYGASSMLAPVAMLSGFSSVPGAGGAGGGSITGGLKVDGVEVKDHTHAETGINTGPMK